MSEIPESDEVQEHGLAEFRAACEWCAAYFAALDAMFPGRTVGEVRRAFGLGRSQDTASEDRSQAQDSLRDQIIRVLALANQHGEYDAADFIKRAFFGENTDV